MFYLTKFVTCDFDIENFQSLCLSEKDYLASFLRFVTCTRHVVARWKIRDSFLDPIPWVPEVFFSLGATELSGEAAKSSREAARKKPLAPTDNNLTSMPTPISFD